MKLAMRVQLIEQAGEALQSAASAAQHGRWHTFALKMQAATRLVDDARFGSLTVERSEVGR